MRSHHTLMLVSVLALLPCLGQAGYVWIEGEAPTTTNVEPQVSGWGRQHFLSEEKWLQVSIDADKIDAQLPAEGGRLTYAFTVAEAGAHEAWVRIGYEFARSPFDWRIDDGEWARIEPDALTTDLMELQTWNEVAWLKLGELPLTKGDHRLDLRLPKTQDKEGKTARVLFALDAICLHAGPFYPNSKHRPEEDYRTDRDREAAQHVFALPDAGAPGARTSLGLAGPWEVCRADEQLPGEVATPMAGFPEHPYWRGIPVPGDKNKLREDLIFCHRLWFRARVEVPASQTGRSFVLEFPQNNLNTTVYVNGVYCGFNKNPFARFSIDVTKGIEPGRVNEVWVGIRDAYYGFSTNPDDPLKLRRMFNYPLEWANKGFMDLAYPVWNHFQSGLLVTPTLTAAGSAYVGDVFCKPSVARSELALEVTLANPSAQEAAGEVLCEAVNAESGQVEKAFAPQPLRLAAGAEQALDLVEAWPNPKLWWPDAPNLYRLRATVKLDGQTVDVSETTFGFREWTFDGPDFRLNGVPFHGWADCHTAGSADEWLANYRRFSQTIMRFWGTSWQGLPPEEALSFLDRNGVVCRRSGILDGEAIGYYAIERDEDLRTLYNSEIKLQLMENWRDQIVAQVKGERNHPSVMIWSIENEWLYINCINLYGGLMDQFEAEVTKVSDAVRSVDPTRPTMVDGGGATQAQTLPVHGDHYVTSKPQDYPDLAYQANPTGGGRGRWEWDQKRPRFLGEDFYMTGNHPEVAYFEGESAFAGKPRRGVAIWNRILQEGYRWAGYGAWHFWLGQNDTDESQYIANAPRALLCRQWDWTFPAGGSVSRTFGLFNDTHSADPITFTWTLTLDGKQVATESKEYAVPPGTNRKFDVVLTMPKTEGRKEGKLFLKLTVRGQEVFLDTKEVSVLAPALPRAPEASLTAQSLVVFDPRDDVRDALDARESASSRLSAYAAGDRRVIVLEQTDPLRYQGLPCEMSAATNAGRTAFGEDVEHPALQGLQQKDFFTWGADTLVYRNAYEKPARGAKSLVQCDDQLRHTALAEVPVGQGLMLLSQLTVGEHLGTSAVAQQLLLNLVAYAASYRLEFAQVAAAVSDNPQLANALDAMGLQYTSVEGPLQALAAEGVRTAVVSATPANLRMLADNLARVEAFTSAGGSLILCGLTPEGLADYNRIVGVDHMIRPFRRERVVFPPVRDRLTSGLTTGDVVLYSSERIFSWTAGNYVVSDMFSYVVDYDEVASFGTSPFFAYENITNGFVSADGWPLIINFPKHADDSPYDVPIALQQPQSLTEFTWIGNVFYYPQTKVNLIFDGDREHMLSFDTEPNAEPQTFAINPPREATEVTVQIAGWTPVPDKAPNIGIDNLYLRAQRSPEFHERVKPMLNVGGLMHYVRGKGNIVLCNLAFKDNEEVPENAGKKRAILAAILRNLKAPFVGGKTVIAGANLEYQPIDLSAYAKQFRDERGWFGDRNFTFKDMPSGRQVLAGVPYQVFEFATSPVPTVIMLGGPGIPNDPPEEVRGIAIGAKADALFFLQTARLDAQRNRDELRDGKRYEMLRYVVKYADGQTADIPICAEIDLGDYHPQDPRPIPGAQIAWMKPYEGTDRTAVAYSKQWNNPRPEVPIESLDMAYGADRRGVPALIALTIARAAE
ncbi:MAG: hypothetical protein FJX74_08780 [Armatimonadetes bacterium]|nr:hypothetical protein [Armatimonadota bacterium]